MEAGSLKWQTDPRSPDSLHHAAAAAMTYMHYVHCESAKHSCAPMSLLRPWLHTRLSGARQKPNIELGRCARPRRPAHVIHQQLGVDLSQPNDALDRPASQPLPRRPGRTPIARRRPARSGPARSRAPRQRSLPGSNPTLGHPTMIDDISNHRSNNVFDEPEDFMDAEEDQQQHPDQQLGRGRIVRRRLGSNQRNARSGQTRRAPASGDAESDRI